MSIVFLVDENPDVASAGSGGVVVGGARSVPDHEDEFKYLDHTRSSGERVPQMISAAPCAPQASSGD